MKLFSRVQAVAVVSIVAALTFVNQSSGFLSISEDEEIQNVVLPQWNEQSDIDISYKDQDICPCIPTNEENDRDRATVMKKGDMIETALLEEEEMSSYIQISSPSSVLSNLNSRATSERSSIILSNVSLVTGTFASDWFRGLQVVDQIFVDELFIVEAEVTNTGSETVHVLSLYTWELIPDTTIDVVGNVSFCQYPIPLDPGQTAVLYPFCLSNAFKAISAGSVSLDITVKDWMNSVLCQETFTFTINQSAGCCACELTTDHGTYYPDETVLCNLSFCESDQSCTPPSFSVFLLGNDMTQNITSDFSLIYSGFYQASITAGQPGLYILFTRSPSCTLHASFFTVLSLYCMVMHLMLSLMEKDIRSVVPQRLIPVVYALVTSQNCQILPLQILPLPSGEQEFSSLM
jgi:hypothetical protein